MSGLYPAARSRWCRMAGPNFLREPSVNDLDVNYRQPIRPPYETVDVDVPGYRAANRIDGRGRHPTPSSKHGRSLISESRFVFPAPFSGSRRPCNGRSRKRWIRFSPYRARCRPRRASCTKFGEKYYLFRPKRSRRKQAAGEWCTSGSMIRGLRTPYRMSHQPGPNWIFNKSRAYPIDDTDTLYDSAVALSGSRIPRIGPDPDPLCGVLARRYSGTTTGI